MVVTVAVVAVAVVVVVLVVVLAVVLAVVLVVALLAVLLGHGCCKGKACSACQKPRQGQGTQWFICLLVSCC